MTGNLVFFMATDGWYYPMWRVLAFQFGRDDRVDVLLDGDGHKRVSAPAGAFREAIRQSSGSR